MENKPNGELLYTDKNNAECNLKPFDFLFFFLAFCTFYRLKSLKYFMKSKKFAG